jgi:hypothetical protein
MLVRKITVGFLCNIFYEFTYPEPAPGQKNFGSSNTEGKLTKYCPHLCAERCQEGGREGQEGLEGEGVGAAPVTEQNHAASGEVTEAAAAVERRGGFGPRPHWLL